MINQCYTLYNFQNSGLNSLVRELMLPLRYTSAHSKLLYIVCTYRFRIIALPYPQSLWRLWNYRDRMPKIIHTNIAISRSSADDKKNVTHTSPLKHSIDTLRIQVKYYVLFIFNIYTQSVRIYVLYFTPQLL